jgi:hypothetical protein
MGTQVMCGSGLVRDGPIWSGERFGAQGGRAAAVAGGEGVLRAVEWGHGISWVKSRRPSVELGLPVSLSTVSM